VNVLAVDVGGTHVKILATGQVDPRKLVSGPTLTAKRMVAAVKKLAAGWKYDVVSIGYPGLVVQGHPVHEPYNLGGGWVGFDFDRAFGRRVKVINDAAMQALGSYKGGKMLFVGLGTGLGTAMIVNGDLEPLELAHLPYRKGTYEDYVGLRGLRKRGKKKWRRYVVKVVNSLAVALEPEEIVLGGGNAKLLKTVPGHWRIGNNANAFLGGFRLWDKAVVRSAPARPKVRVAKRASPAS
jgi:polyphosphate glucokinase